MSRGEHGTRGVLNGWDFIDRNFKKGLGWWRRGDATTVLTLVRRQKMKRRVLSLDCIVCVVMTICSTAALFIGGSSYAIAESGIASVYAYSGGKTASGERTNPADSPLLTAR
jgi:rare lipoprotein A (peptidoglycan hydrolase)